MANLTSIDIETAMTTAATLGDRLMALVALRKQAQAELQATANQVQTGTLTDAQGEALHDASMAVLSYITRHRIGIEALI